MLVMVRPDGYVNVNVDVNSAKQTWQMGPCAGFVSEATGTKAVKKVIDRLGLGTGGVKIGENIFKAENSPKSLP